jgi:hypothetical protein
VLKTVAERSPVHEAELLQRQSIRSVRSRSVGCRRRAAGRRHRRNFSLKRDADSERIRIERQIQTGTHIPDNASRTVLQGCQA